MKQRFFVLYFTVMLGLFVIFASGSEDRVQDNKYSPLAVKECPVNPPVTLKKDLDFGNIPLYFIINQGQVDEKVRFYAKTPRYTLWLTKDGLVFDSFKRVEDSNIPSPLQDHSFQEGNIERDVSRLIFLGSNKNPGMVPIDLTQHRVNFIKGKDRSDWQIGIQTSKAVLYKNIYKKINLKVYGIEKQIEYDWIIKPGGNPEDIRFKYENAASTYLDNQGNLVIETALGELLHKKPLGYQVINGERIEVRSEFSLIGENTYAFKVGSYNSAFELIIDPVVSLEYSTYLGGSNDELYTRMVVDKFGQVHLTGYTYSYDFPIKNAYQPSKASSLLDAILTKFDSSGSNLIFSTYFGGSSSEYFFAITVAGNGDIYIAGDTFSSDLPAINSRIGGKDVFIARFDSSGNFLAGRYLGGSYEDRNMDIVLDSSGHLWAAGWTRSGDFPTVNPYQGTLSGSACVCISKITSDLSDIEYSTYLGGTGEDTANRIVIDNSGYFYVSGRTSSTNFPLKNAWQNNYGGGQYDIFLARFKPDGSDLDFSTYLGGSGADYWHSLALGNSGSVYVGGFTDSTDFPTINPYQENNAGNQDVFISAFNSDGSQLLYSTYLGGTADDQHGALVLDSSGNIYVSGTTYSSNFPTKAPYQSTKKGSNDAFLSILAAGGTDLVYSTFFGGSGWDRCLNIARDSSGNIYLAGNTGSSDFPVVNSYQPYIGGAEDAYFSKFSIAWTLNIQSTPDPGVPITVTPNDTNGDGDGNTNFTRIYRHGEMVTLTAPGTYNQKAFYKWLIDGVENFNRTIQVTMDKGHMTAANYESPSGIYLSRTHLNFGACLGKVTTGIQNFFIESTGILPLNWTISDNVAWLTCSPASGTNSGEVTVSVDASGLAAGTYYGTITVSAPNASNSPQTINVTLMVYKVNTTGAPFGYFETPLHGARVYSSIPVTGWTLDDIGVEHVKIYREEGKDLVYIGDAVFVEGARPDVEQAYPYYPNCYKAGWGYMMLTNFLPNGGNGTFKLHAIATDKEGYHVTLGSKTITCDNAHAVKPFGAIDIPPQGGAASGSHYRNQGWALTPLPNKIPEDGHTMIVWLDGVNLGNPTYNIYREDIANLFPGYANSNGAMAYLDFDTTTYENGVHTIQWTAVDNAGNVDGIGSRYFMIQNATQQAQQSAKSAKFTAHTPGGITPDQAFAITTSTPLGIAKGYKTNVEPTELEMIYPDQQGMITVEIKELERIEIHLGSERKISGWMLVGDQFRPLPIGSYLDQDNGIFYWMTGLGFVGKYHLVFIEEDQYGKRRGRNIVVKIKAKF